MSHTHNIKIDTPSIDEVGEMSFSNGEGLAYSTTSMDATIEQRKCMNAIMRAMDNLKMCCGGLTEFRIKIKP